MSRYVEILAVQRPFDIGPDDSDRVQLSCNYECTAAGPVTAFESEIAQLLVAAGLGTLNTDIFIGRKSTLPPSADPAGPFTTIIATSGMPPTETHNGTRYERLTCQIVVRALAYPTARTRAMAIWRELDGRRNVTVVAP